jgi:hypothetical protein
MNVMLTADEDVWYSPELNEFMVIRVLVEMIDNRVKTCTNYRLEKGSPRTIEKKVQENFWYPLGEL